MRPKHFWYLQETLSPPDAKRSLSKTDKGAILQMLKGNDNGGFW